MKSAGRDVSPRIQMEDRQVSSSGSTASTRSGRRSNRVSTAVRATTSASSGAGYGHRCSPLLEDRCAESSAPTCASGHNCGSVLAAARPRTRQSPARIGRPPSCVSFTAQRPVTFCVGASSHSTSAGASPTLSRPPETLGAKRSSVSSSLRVLPIQLAVGCWAAATTEIRSCTVSSSVSPPGGSVSAR
ncbi:hypothetical protein FM21_31060 [Streptomyces mutabilis]|uniref:Uncharacterized protein n=1 Tax=Streptomyces mutabilis TaxID=67332 RepID=A0A086MSY2_9ACTN|nr:hypothetical protein FM21_31060 [Streptomyces mutabilis]